MKHAAFIISRLLDPIVEIPLILLIVTISAYSFGFHWRFFSLLFLLDVVLPGLYFGYLLYTKRVSDWDISLRQERLTLFRFTLITHGLGVLVAYVIGREPLAQLLFGFWILGVVLALITFIWKISLHAAINSSLATIIIIFYGFQYWWLLFLPIIVSWSRVILKKHSLAQVIAGTLLPIVLLVPIFLWLNVI